MPRMLAGVLLILVVLHTNTALGKEEDHDDVTTDQDDVTTPTTDQDDYVYVIDDNTTGDDCEPNLADLCFADMNENLLCHLVSPIGRNCTMRNAVDLCQGFEAALNCSGGIIDADCSAAQGRHTFDTWHYGFRAVHHYLCNDPHHVSDLQELLDNVRCWNVKKFLSCVEYKANITHVADLLTTHLTHYECNHLMMSVSVCNADAEKNRWNCIGTGDVIHKSLAMFFSETECGLTSSINCYVAAGSSVAGATLLSTVVVMAVLVVLLLMVLHRKRCITITPRSLRDQDDAAPDSTLEDYSRLT